MTQPERFPTAPVQTQILQLPRPSQDLSFAKFDFDKEDTRLFFDLIDRRYNKEGSFNMIFTSNKNPALWREDFEEDATLLCTLDRIFDDATMFKLRGESFRGKKLETVSLQTGKAPAVETVATRE